VPPAISDRFPQSGTLDAAVPVWCVTPAEGRCIHRFFDTSPISPSGRLLAVTRLPGEDRMPEPGEPAEVVVVDLAAGDERTVAQTRGWDTQLGAQCQWGRDDSELYFNDCDVARWRPFGVRLDPGSGRRTELDGTVYMVSPDGTQAASPCLLRTARTQAGYGVLAPDDAVPHNHGASDDDGLFLTDLPTGESRLLLSLGQIVADTELGRRPDDYAGGDFYAAHVKWNPQGDRLQLVLRWKPRDPTAPMKPSLITFAPDGSDLHIAVPDRIWGKGGHHPNWCPDGEHVMMNLALHGRERGMFLVRVRYDGTGLEPLTEAVPGSGHPAMHPNGRHVITDCYPGEPMTFEDRSVPLRLIDVAAGTEETVARVRTVPDFNGPENELRVDPHPAWGPEHRRIAFNAYPDGTRRVFVADLAGRIP
jgi:hypothetical protein